MSRASTLILLGVLTILTPFSGLPSSIRSLLAVIFGASISAIGLSLRAREVRTTSGVQDAPASEPVSPQGVSPI